MPGIGIINNPKSKQNRLHPERIRMLGYILGHGGESKATHTFEELEECLLEFKRLEIDILAINGGDGSNHHTISKLIDLYGDQKLPKIALLRGGTLNTISRGFDIKGNPAGILHRVATKYAEGKPFVIKECDLMNVNGMYSFLFGNGIVAKYMKTYYETGEPSPSHGVKIVLKGIFSAITGGKLTREWFEPICAKVWVDGDKLESERFTSIIAGSMEDIGVGFKPWIRAFTEDRKFHCLFITAKPLTFIWDIPYFYFARPMHPRSGSEAVCSHIHIEADAPFVYNQDGDMHECQDGIMDIRVGPRVEIIVE
jgi:diacylglycerol kinase family enzyme